MAKREQNKEKLESFLNRCNATHIKVGAENGSGWFFAGPLDEWDNEKVTLSARDWWTHCQRNAENTLSKRLNSFRLLDARTMSAAEWQTVAIDAAKGIAKASKNTELIKMAIKKFKPMNERGVVEVSDSDGEIAVKKCLRIIIEGSELGGFWQLKDATKGPILFGSGGGHKG